MNNLIRAALISLFAIGLNACAFDRVKKAYDGPEQPLTELSVLSCSAGTHFVAIDGNKAYTGTGNDCRFAVRPGKHQVTMKFFESVQGGRWVYPELHTIEIDAKKGYRYGIMAHRRDGEWLIRIFDAPLDKDKAVATSERTDFVPFRVVK